MPQITVKGMAKFMTRGHAAQRKVLRDFKFPDPEGFAQARYYAEARQAIRDFHEADNDPLVLVEVVDDLRTRANRSEGRRRTRVEHNIRAIESYLEHFPHRRFGVLSTPELEYQHGNVIVSAAPDLCVREKGRVKLIKLELGADSPDPRMIKIILQVVYEAASSSGLSIRPQDVICLDAERATQHRGARLRSRMRREIAAACENIEALWPSIK